VDGPAGRGGVGLRARLVGFSVLLTVVAVAASFLAVSFEIRRQTRRLLEDTLARHQRTAVGLQTRSLEQILRTASLMAENPTLRAAMETYRSESGSGANDRRDLLRTIDTEAGKLAAELGRDLFVVTDGDGRVLASAGRHGRDLATGEPLASRAAIGRALDETMPAPAGNFGILTVRGVPYQVGCVPILLQGYVIGTLTLGDRLDSTFASASRDTFGGEVVVAVGGRIVGSTMAGPVPELRDIHGPVARIVVGHDEYVVAPLALGTDEDGRAVTLCLLESLTAALGRSYRSMVLTLTACGLFAVIGVGIAAWMISRSILRPFDAFVRFLRSVAESGDRSRRFDAAGAGPEVTLLNETYGELIEAVTRHEERLLRSAQDDMDRLARLKESEKLAALGRMLSGAAHEINNPLTGVVGNVQILLARNVADPYVRDRLVKVHKESQRIVALVRNLLKIAHRDAGARGVVDANRLVADAVELRRHDFVSAGIAIDLSLTPSRTRLFANELELQQVIVNIVNNAFDALKESSVADRGLFVRTETAGETVTIAIRDNGPGMKDPSKVFEHFYTTKDVGKGTGLGLSIAYTIVHDHDGTIRADNHPEGGALFTIELPAAAAAAREPAAPAAPQSPRRSDRVSGTVLVVDDEAEVLDLEMEILGALGVSVSGARTGADAIALLEQRDFDVVVSDLKMPGGVSGEELFRWASENRPGIAERFVFVSGDTASEATREFLQEPGRRFVLKPFSSEDLAQAVRESIDARLAAS
jgi:signal transduction histidine kinase/CheY-like chemotaxis protein